MRKTDYELLGEAYTQKILKEEGEQPPVETNQETSHDETNMSNPEEKREVQIGKQILQAIEEVESQTSNFTSDFEHIKELAQELVTMHSSEGCSTCGSAADIIETPNEENPGNYQHD